MQTKEFNEIKELVKPVFEFKIDNSASTIPSKTGKKYYVRQAYPSCFITDNMTYKEAQKVIKSMRQLGFTVIDRTK